jgi:hypothetical protein
MTRYYLTLPDPKAARGSDANTSFSAHGAAEFASELEQALRSTALFERWRGQQKDPDDIDQALAAVDPAASVTGEQNDLRIDLVATTSLPASILRHRLRLLAGDGWQLRDVAA